MKSRFAYIIYLKLFVGEGLAPPEKTQYIRVQRYTYNGDIKLKKGKDNMSAVKDLTKGSPMKLILGFMLPMLLGLLFQQFYNMVDTIVVGQFLGVNALAGVGFDRLGELPCSRLLHGCMRRLCNTRCAEIRREGF